MENKLTQKNVGIIGSGSWATALAKVLETNDVPINWYFRKNEDVEYFNLHHHNPKYLSEVIFHKNIINCSSDLKKVCENSDILLIVTPSAFLEDIFNNLGPQQLLGKIIVNAVKGLIGSHPSTISQFLGNLGIKQDDIVGITGPCHAEEVSAEKLSFLTFHGSSIINTTIVAELFKTEYLNTKVGHDLEAAEIASVMKNIYALGTGITIGLGYGDNYRAIFISNAMGEMRSFLQKHCPCDELINERNILDASFLGDMMVTAYSPHSRNRTFGVMIGKGYSIQNTILEMKMVAEGYYATKAIYDLAKEYQIELPILEAVYSILYEKHPANVEFSRLSSFLG